MGATLQELAAAVGLGGVALAVMAYVFRDILRAKIFPRLSRQQAFLTILLIIACVTTVAIISILFGVPKPSASFDVRSDMLIADIFDKDEFDHGENMALLRNEAVTVDAKVQILETESVRVIPCYIDNVPQAPHIKYLGALPAESINIRPVAFDTRIEINGKKMLQVARFEDPIPDAVWYELAESRKYCSAYLDRSMLAKSTAYLPTGSQVEKHTTLSASYSTSSRDTPPREVHIADLTVSQYEREIGQYKEMTLMDDHTWLVMRTCMLHGGDSRGSILVYNGKEGSEAEAELSSKYSRDFCGIRDDVVFDDET